ncbi:MAG: LPS-assembly protein LptD [Nitrospina sp.]|jgi:LPS-assembly protein|nr:LPS-assembly protein LptD [Nitrospina sp.]MBT6716241.1 LPS-assembly protein LptD [Nitrospina sp.]
MKKTFLILGILLSLANDAYSSDDNPPILPESDSVISSQHKRDELPVSSDGIYSDDEVFITPSGYKIVPGDIPNWFWADGTPLTPDESENLDYKFGPTSPDDSPDWYWADGKPLTSSETKTMPNSLKFPEWIRKNSAQRSSPKKVNNAKRSKDEVFLLADHLRQNVKKEIIWAWGKVKIRLENKTIQADKIKINNKTGEGIAKGNVIIKNSDGTHLKAIKSRFNIKNQKGKIFQTRGRLGKTHFIKSSELSRLSEKHYTAKSASLTTCRGKLPDWLFEAETMDIIAGDRAIFTGGVLKIRDVPVFYIPAGYLPMDKERKSGLLFPSFGNSDIDGATLNNEYYWAIDDHSDATFKLGYRSKRGFTPGIEYRYTPSLGTSGFFSGSFIDDKITDSTFWKVDASHSQDLPFGFKFSGTLDLESEEFNKTFNDNTNERARRISDSFATASKRWDSSTLDIITRYRDSSEIASDQTLAELPEITYKTQRQLIGDTGFYFNQDTNFTSFLTDLNSDPDVDDNFSVQRFDFHPQLTRTFALAPWLSFTPTLGLRETLYSKGLEDTGFFSRESLDLSARLEGPKFEKIFATRNKLIPKVKHLIEPRLTFNFIPDIDRKDKDKIRTFDAIDSVSPQSQITYSLTQRILQKEADGKGDFNTREALRFTLSQSYDIREATKTETADNPSEPFSDIRFDVDSRLIDPLLINFDSTYDVHDEVLKTFNFEIGFKPVDTLTFFVERRFTRRGETSTLATIDWDFKKGWNFKASTRLDEETMTHRENNFSLLYDDPCQCWGFNVDFIQRDNFNGGARSQESKFLMGITFRGLGSIKSGAKEKFIHREFKSIK